MKKTLFFYLLFFANSAFANKIDSLKSDEDVAKFVFDLHKKKYEDRYTIFSIKYPYTTASNYNCDSLFLKENRKRWEKLDFNQDERTDLFTMIYSYNSNDKGGNAFLRNYVIIDNGNEVYDLQEIAEYFLPISFNGIKPFYIDNNLVLSLHYSKLVEVEDSSILMNPNLPDSELVRVVEKTDTLIYKYGSFVELNTLGLGKQIKSISFETSPCFGPCQAFKMFINSDSSAKYIALPGLYDNKSGKFKTKIKPKQYEELIGFIGYLNVTKLKDNYRFLAFHQATSVTIINFEDGTSKKISDYGEQGTLGLYNLYKMFFNLRENQIWKKIN
jgi:Domain of unknown function (DUF6438)